MAERVNQFARLNYLLDCQFTIHTCDIYGRVSEKNTGKVIEVKEAPKVEFSVRSGQLAVKYKMGEKLRKLMPKSQQLAVKEIIGGEEGPDYIENVLKRLEREVDAIPKLYATDEVEAENKQVLAHFFHGGSDWYVVEWDGKDSLFCYTILNGDDQNAEWGYQSLSELHSVKMMQLDFFWEVREFWKVMGMEKANESKINSILNQMKLATDLTIQEIEAVIEETGGLIASGKHPELEETLKMVLKNANQELENRKNGNSTSQNPIKKPKPKIKTNPVKKVKADNNKQSLLDAADALRTAAEFLEGKEQQSMNDAAEALETAAEFL